MKLSDPDELGWFDTTQFAAAPEDRRGNAPIGVIDKLSLLAYFNSVYMQADT